MEKFYLNLFNLVENFHLPPYAENQYAVGSLAFNLISFNEVSFRVFSSSIEHLSHSACNKADWCIYVVSEKIDGVSFPKAPFEMQFFRGIYKHELEKRFCLTYIGDLNAYLVFDYEERRAVCWFLDIEEIPWYEKVMILKYLAPRLFRDEKALMLHAAAVGIEGEGVLLVGKSGVGKSTTSLNCLLSEFEFVADDYCLYKDGDVFSVSKYAKLLLGENLGFVEQDLEYFRGADKAVLNLFSRFKDKLVSHLRVKAILLPSISNKSGIEVCTKAEALKALAPSSLGQIAGTSAREMRIISELVREVSVYNLFLGRNVKANVDAVREVLSF